MADSIPISLKKFLADKRFVYVDYLGLNARKPVFRGLHPRSLISAFVIRLLESIIGKLATDEISIL